MQLDRRKYDNLSMEDKINVILEKLDQLEEAFPFGLENHRTMHEQIEQNKKSEQEFIRDLKLTLAKNTIMAIILFILSAAVLGLASKWTAIIKGL